MRSWIKRLERASREEFIEIPQEDGTVKRFPASWSSINFWKFDAINS